MNLQCHLQDYQVPPASAADLSRRPTRVAPLYRDKKHYQELLAEYRAEIQELQSVLYAHNRYAVLLVFQGMDTAGKDGAIKHVMSGVNPQGCQVFSFKQPSSGELDHDFLWRTHKCLPERGRIGIFNRSYYEEVLVARVNPAVLRNQRLPEEFVDPQRIWKERYQDIVHMEDYLHRNGTRIIKFFLHLSREEQRQRFLGRIDDPDKNWKLTPADIAVRQQWDAYQTAYADCLAATSAAVAPWYVIPADDKRNARLLVSQIIVETMKTLKMHYPRVTEEHRRELADVRRLLEAEVRG
jgi:PPK2 family polyphosphate:nucleotide phosphotransferase